MIAAACVLATATSLAALLLAEWRDHRPGVWVAKPLASAGFVLLAVALGAPASGYGRLVLAALLLSWLGDVLLIVRGAQLPFLLGLTSFLAGHVAYAIAFVGLGPDGAWSAAAAVGVFFGGAAALRWLDPHVRGRMRPAVAAYVVVIGAMVVAAAGAAGGTGRPLVLAGALGFAVSDLAVARERFVAPSFAHKLWGLPLYYAAQLLLAGSVA